MPRNEFKGWIWPKDSRPGRSWFKNRMSAWHDVFTGQGPDIYVGRLNTFHHRPSKPRWSNWGNLFGDIPPDDVANHLLPFANNNRDGQVYDFRSRRYRDWNFDLTSSMWSDVKRCPNKWASLPLAYRDAWGRWNDLSEHHRDPLDLDTTCHRKYH